LFSLDDLAVLGCSINMSVMLLFSVSRYVRVLGAFYLRLTGTVADVYQYLEPLYNDYRKIRHKLSDGRMHQFFFTLVIINKLGVNI
jgi:hypothetical protein